MYKPGMVITVSDITGWGPDRREALLQRFVADLHPSSEEDFRWNAEVFGMDRRSCLDLFAKAERLACVWADAQPFYLFAVASNRYVSTLSTKQREALKLSLTKAVRRWIAEGGGRAFFEGSYGAADVSDLSDQGGQLPVQWPEMVGFVYADTVSINGKRINRYAFQGV